MKVKKTIKKIAALGMGATMLGATILGASAADLGNYPGMFMDNGQFNGLVVVGKQADSVDTIGGMNIMGGLQAAAVTKTTVCGTGATSTASVSEGVQIDKSSSHFIAGQDIQGIMSTLDDGDLPEVLADGNYDESEETKNDVDFTQVLKFTAGTGTFMYFQDDDDAPEAGPYLFFDDANGVWAYEYVLHFDTAVTYDGTTAATIGDDVESTTIELQGQTYTITEAKGTTGAASALNKLTMLVGDTLMWMTQDETITKSVDGVEHEITMLDVTEDADACGFQVDGTSVWVDVDSTETVNGVTLGVTDAKAVHTETYDADICKVSLGATELILEAGQRVDKDGDDVDGSEVTLQGESAGTGEDWTGLTIQWQPENDLYLAPGDELVDPVFGNFKFVFGGVVADYEEISFDVSGDEDGSFKFTNTAGNEVEVPIYTTSGNIYLADGGIAEDELIYLGDGSANATCTGTTDVRDCENAQWLLVDNDEAHLIKLKDVDMTNLQLDFEDVTEGSTVTDKTYTGAGATDTIYISGFGDVDVTVSANNKSITIEESAAAADPTDIETEFGARLNGIVGVGTDTLNISWMENDDDGDVGEEIINATFKLDASGDLILDSPTIGLTGTTGAWHLNNGAVSDDDDDNRIYVTPYGSEVLYDSEDDDSLLIKHPEESVKAEVFVTPTGAALSVSDAGEGCQVTETVNKIPSTVNKFDTEVSNPAMYNLVSVGGPCANSVTSALLGNPEVCYEGFEAGKALLKLVESGDKVALVVAGGTGADTRIASTVLQNYEQYSSQLKGSELMLTTVSENNIGFEAVQ